MNHLVRSRQCFPGTLIAMNEIVGVVLAERNPLADPGYTTAMNSARVVKDCLSPLTTEHGHDE